MDADDISLPARLDRQVKFLDQYSNVGLLGTWWYVINGDGREIGISRPPSGEQAVHFMCHGSTVVRRICLEKVGFYREIFELAQDYDLWLRIADEFEVVNLCEPLYERRIHMDSVSAQKKLEQDLYASLALELAEERREKGKDRLNNIGHREAERIRDQKMSISGIKRAKLLSGNYSIWSQASLDLGDYPQALDYAIRALKLYCFNNQALRLLLKSLVKESNDKSDEVIPTLSSHVKHFLLNVSKRLVEAGMSLNVPGADKIYWNRRADDIDEKWGGERDDYELLREIITSLKPNRVFDFGCGSGRLFPLYHDLGIPEVIAQDISTKALRIAKNRYAFSNIKITNDDILALSFEKNYFDIIISNRVLQHISHDKIDDVIKKLTELAEVIYINEFSNSDYSHDSFYIFKHSFLELFEKYDCKVIKKGMLDNKTWYLFKKYR
jgi:hypothetical protein